MMLNDSNMMMMMVTTMMMMVMMMMAMMLMMMASMMMAMMIVMMMMMMITLMRLINLKICSLAFRKFRDKSVKVRRSSGVIKGKCGVIRFPTKKWDGVINPPK